MNDIQKEILDIYKEFVKICQENNLRYFSVVGTMLGAVRHNGFIPWDDDIDVAMPLDDYNKLFNSNIIIDNKYRLRKSVDMEYSTLMFNKIENINTTMIEKNEINHPCDYKGIYIDVFPLYGLPDNDKKNRKLVKKLQHIFKLNENLRCDYNECLNKKAKLIWLIQHPLRLITNKKFWNNIWNKMLEKYNNINSPYIGYLFDCKLKYEAVIYKGEWFKEYIELPFEDTTMRIPKGYDYILKQKYGDYMKLPPIEKRINHSNGFIDLKKPYSYYQNNIGEVIEKKYEQ